MAKKSPVSLELAMGSEVPAEAAGQGAEVFTLAPQAKPAQAVEKMTVYVPRAAAKRLKQMALDHDKRLNDFLQEGLDMVLAKYGERSLAEFKAK